MRPTFVWQYPGIWGNVGYGRNYKLVVYIHSGYRFQYDHHKKPYGRFEYHKEFFPAILKDDVFSEIGVDIV